MFHVLKYSSFRYTGDTFKFSSNLKKKKMLKWVQIPNLHENCTSINKSMFGPVVLEIACDIFIYKVLSFL